MKGEDCKVTMAMIDFELSLLDWKKNILIVRFDGGCYASVFLNAEEGWFPRVRIIVSNTVHSIGFLDSIYRVQFNGKL